MYQRQPTIYIGYDAREHLAFETLVKSIELTSSVKNLNIVKLDQYALRSAGLYRRAWTTAPDNRNQKIDLNDGKPFSTDFSFTRFLIPHLNQYEGYAIFMDCDMLVRSDIMEVFDRYTEDVHAVSCVWHKYQPNHTTKMDNQIQETYSMKNWSSFMLWNCGHKANLNLTVDDVNTKSGHWLHNFKWLDGWAHGRMTQYPIGKISEEWNWLDHHSSETIEPKNVHFTTGGPWFDNWSASRDVDIKYATEWNTMKDKIIMEEGLSNV